MEKAFILAVVGGGAAGFFAALRAAEAFPQARVTIFEKSREVLGKVRISGGGRCNLTHAAASTTDLLKGYPRGATLLRPLLARFDHRATCRWFEQRGVPLKTEPDGRVFPSSDSSESIISCLKNEARRLGVHVRTSAGVRAVLKQPDGGFSLLLPAEEIVRADRVIMCSGGHPSLSGFDLLAALGHAIVPPVPSLFTFNVPTSPLLGLAGVAAPEATVRLPGTRQAQTGPVLLTHWGFSGPAVLRLSAWAARELAAQHYQFDVAFAWNAAHTAHTVQQQFAELRRQYPRRQVAAQALFELPNRLWRFLVAEAGLPETTRWAEAPAKGLNRLSELLSQGVFRVQGKTTFKEEFVTCGGVALSDIHPQTLESRPCPGLYLAGEVLDVDGITGGYNFQAAWTTGWVAGQSCGDF